MAWVLKMDEVIESGLVHDFDASLTGIGQELGAGAYSMRYGTAWAGRAPPYPWGKACRTLGLCQARLRSAVPRAYPARGPGLPRGRRGRAASQASAQPGGGLGSAALQPWAPAWPRVSFFAVKHARLLQTMAWVDGEGVSFPCK